MAPPNGLASLCKLTRWIVLQKARRHPRRGSDSLYAHNFRFYFTPLSAVLFAFPSRYLFTIDRKTYLALEGGPSGFSQGFTCPDLLENIDNKVSATSHTWLSQSMAPLSSGFCSPRKFFTLCRMMIAPAVPCGGFVEKPEILCMVDLYLTTPY